MYKPSLVRWKSKHLAISLENKIIFLFHSLSLYLSTSLFMHTIYVCSYYQSKDTCYFLVTVIVVDQQFLIFVMCSLHFFVFPVVYTRLSSLKISNVLSL